MTNAIWVRTGLLLVTVGVLDSCQTPKIFQRSDSRTDSARVGKSSDADLLRAANTDLNAAMGGAAPHAGNCARASAVDKVVNHPQRSGVPARQFIWKPGQGPRDAACGNKYDVQASLFANESDSKFSKTSGYTEETIVASECICALPMKFRHRLINGKVVYQLPILKLSHAGRTTYCRVEDIGPHYGSDLGSNPYWTNEENNHCHPKARNNKGVNKAGIDLTPGCFNQLGGSESAGFMNVSWSFI